MPAPLFTPPPDAASSPSGPSAHQVRLAGDGTGFEAPGSQTLLVSAEAAGLPWPSSCRNGTCRTCMRLAVGGQVTYRIAWPGLSAEEKSEGWILPCVAYPASDLLLQDPPPDAGI
ncbi:2Fe-2S iron-sulfur cluster binding domain-containing protein [Polaromonas sp. YR568]|uniref:2Fe-2S iron-sulfur cluster-binding protein n=1 Tax=Polaromonas sp. YR568 TaxID=1855301 RepID=UPI0031379244